MYRFDDTTQTVWDDYDCYASNYHDANIYAHDTEDQKLDKMEAKDSLEHFINTLTC